MNLIKYMFKDKMLKFKVILILPIFALQIYFVTLNIIRPTNVLKHTWHPAIWGSINVFVLLFYGWNLFSVYKRMIKKQFDMNTLLGLSAHSLFIYSMINSIIHLGDATYSYSVFWEGSTLLVIFAFIGNLLETRLRNKSIHGYKELLKLKTKIVVLIKNNEEIETPINEIKIGDKIVVKAKTNVPLDGIIIEGTSQFDYSKITGESKIIIKNKGDEVISGSVNNKARIVMVVKKTLDNSTLSMIIDKAEDLSLIKPKMQILADKILKVFIPSIFVLAFTSFVFWMIMGYAWGIQLSWFKGGNYFDNAFLSSVTILAIACPCALGVATPLVVTVSSSLANKNSLLFSEPDSFEKIKDVKIVVFDKTGTLTTGKMEVVRFEGESKYLKLAAAIEKHSIHPIANAISSKFKNNIKVKKINEITGVGIESIYNGEKYLISKSNKNPKINGATVISLKNETKTLAVFEVIDEIKQNTKETIDFLHEMNIMTVMVTGDSKQAATRVGKILGINNVYSEIIPNRKAEIVKELRLVNNLLKKQQILFIGDGFNDILALKTADISVAFASGSDITNSIADISILDDDLNSLINAIEISRWNQKKIIQSLLWAVVFNICALPIAFMMLVQPWIAAILMLLSDIAVIGNALIYKAKAEKYFKNKKIKK